MSKNSFILSKNSPYFLTQNMSRIQISIQLQYTGEGIIFNVFLFGHFLGKIQAFQSLKAVIRLLWDNKCNYSLKEMLWDTLGTITIILCSTMSLCFFRFLSADLFLACFSLALVKTNKQTLCQILITVSCYINEII